MVHALTHRFDTSLNPNNDQHEQMFKNWVEDIRNGLMDIHGMNEKDATALALDGIDDRIRKHDAKTNTFGPILEMYQKIAQEKYGMSLEEAAKIRHDYEFRENGKGTPCN